ncbi:unnamed protein product [Rangifer tarandus platyrhynchus]|uniref:Uncharacterized protein n=1 Tax=Rangifer tarandus platyrhynchus TaxID=3082113 RepID=A0AC60AA58_RANTA
MQWRRGQQCQRPSALLKVFTRSGALRTESPGHWVTGGGGNQGPSPVPGHWVTTPLQSRLSPEVPSSRLGAETESLLQGWGGRRAQEPAPGWVAPKARVSPAGDVRLAVTHPLVTDDSELAASTAVWRLMSVRRRGRGPGRGEARVSGC